MTSVSSCIAVSILIEFMLKPYNLSSQMFPLSVCQSCPHSPTTCLSLFTVTWRISTQRKCLCPGCKTAQSSLSAPPMSRTWMGPTGPDAIIPWAPTRGSKVGGWSVQYTNLGQRNRSVDQRTWRKWIPKVTIELDFGTQCSTFLLVEQMHGKKP